MKAIKLLLPTAIIFFMLGCAGCGTYLQSVSETKASKYETQFMSEYEAIKPQMKQQIADTHIIKWVQPANKIEGCKVFVGTSKNDDRTLHPDYKIYWDGQCKDGYAYGLGREFERGFLISVNAIAVYSGGEKVPDYYYQKDNLQNIIMEGDITNGYFVQTKIKDDPLNFYIEYNYGYDGVDDNPYPFFKIISSPMQDNIIFLKGYPNFGYKIVDLRNNEFDERIFDFDLLNSSGRQHGFCFQIDNERIFGREFINGEGRNFVSLPQSYFTHVNNIFDEIKQAGQKAINAQQNAQLVKNEYKRIICGGSVKVNFMDNSEYKTICDEDKYVAYIKGRLDVELAKIKVAKEEKRARFAQERALRAQEMQAMAARQQAAAAHRQADEAEWANIHHMNMNNQIQQLNNNLFRMNLNTAPQRIIVTPNTGRPVWIPVQ